MNLSFSITSALTPFAIVFSLMLSQYALLAKESRGTLHGLIFCDTISPEIRAATTTDVKRMRSTLSAIAHLSQLKEKISILTGKTFSPTHIQRVIRRTQISKNDVIFFYYTGHGFRTSSALSPIPRMCFPCERSGMKGKVVIKALLKLKPRLAIFFFDCCNKILHAKGHRECPSPFLSFSEGGIQTLFSKRHGVIIACGASAGQLAYGIAGVCNYPTGGLFTSSFLYQLSCESFLPTPSWDSLFQKVSVLCQSEAYRLLNVTQTPYLNISRSLKE